MAGYSHNQERHQAAMGRIAIVIENVAILPNGSLAGEIFLREAAVNHHGRVGPGWEPEAPRGLATRRPGPSHRSQRPPACASDTRKWSAHHLSAPRRYSERRSSARAPAGKRFRRESKRRE